MCKFCIIRITACLEVVTSTDIYDNLKMYTVCVCMQFFGLHLYVYVYYVYDVYAWMYTLHNNNMLATG